MIEMKDLIKLYSTGFVKTFVLWDIDLEIEDGEFVTVMGPSGAGKSTMLHIMGMFKELNDAGTTIHGHPGGSNLISVLNVLFAILKKLCCLLET